MSDLDRTRQELGLLTEESLPPLFPEHKTPMPVIPPVPQAVDPLREELGLQTSPMYERGKGPVPEPPAADDPTLSLMRLLASSPDPVAEISRINATQYIAKTFDLDPAQTYANLEELSQYWLGKVVPAPVFAQSLRDAWDNGMKNYDLSKMALQLREQGGNNPALFQQIMELEASLVPLKEIPRPWIKNALLWAMESSPLMAQSFLRGGIMGAGAGAAAGLTLQATPMGLAAAGITEGMSVPAITLAMASVGFAVGSTQDLMQSMRGLAYWRMVKQQVPHNIAAPLSDIEGIIEGAIESVGQVLLGVKLPGLTPALKSAGTLIANKMMATGVVGAMATRIAGQALGAALGEGIEEPLQEGTAILTDLFARELAKNRDIVTALKPVTVEEAARRIGEAAFQGFSAGLVFGVSGAPAGVRADVRQLSTIRELAKRMPTRVGFINSVIRGDYVLQGAGVSESSWREYLGKVWDQQHPGKPAVAAAAPTVPGAPAVAPTPTAEPARGPEGRVYTEVETLRRRKEGITAVLKAGDPATGKRYGFLTFETIGEKVYIEDVVNEVEQDLRRELVLDLMARYPGQEVEWNPTDELDVALKEDLLATNPLGPEAGLQRFQIAKPEAQATAQQELTRGLFVERMGQLFNATTPEQAELYGKLADTFAQVSGQSTQDWLRQYISPEVVGIAPEAAAELKEKTAVAATRFEVGEVTIPPLSVDEFKGQVRAVFMALSKADFHHGVHEFFHAVERLALSPDQVKKFETALGKLRQTWTVEDIETLADRFEDYLATGKAPTEELRSVFQQIAAALKAVLSFIRERLGGEPTLLSPEFQAAYDSLMKKPDSGLAQAVAEAPPAAPTAEVSQVEEGVPPSSEEATTIISPSAVPPVEIELSRITLSTEVPNFKELADKRGIIEALKGEEYVKVGIPPIVLWERMDGRLEVITGRHRLDLAQRLKLPTILSQIVREADGFTAAMAMTFDAESNIRDGQGSVRDYANYFKNSDITEDQASRRGLLDRHKGRTGYAIGRYAADGLYSLYRNDQISEAKAAAIAAAAIAAASLGDERLQSLGITKAKKLSADELGNFLALARQTVTTAAGVQADMFGFDDSLIREGERIAKAVSAKKAELVQERQALSSAIRLSKGAQAKIVEKYGFKAGDTAAIQNRVDVLGEELATWENWTQDPEKMREARQLAGLPAAPQALLHEEEGKPPEPSFDLTPWDDKLLRSKAPAVQPIFDFAEKQEIRLSDWEKTPEGWKHVTGKMADKQTAVTLNRLKDEADTFSLFHRDLELQKRFNTAAVEIFGVTDNPKHGSWILSDGRMLDFSWEKHKDKGYPKYHERIGHIGIEKAVMAVADRQTIPAAYEGAWQAGALRMDVGIMGELSIQSTMIPTDEQMATIEYALAGREMAVLELCSEEGGPSAVTLGWENLTTPAMRDVRRFYEKMQQQLAPKTAYIIDRLEVRPKERRFEIWAHNSKTDEWKYYLAFEQEAQAQRYVDKHNALRSASKQERLALFHDDEGVEINPDSVPRGVLSSMSRTLRAKGYDVRGADDVLALMKEGRVWRNGILWQPDWIAAYERAMESKEQKQARLAGKKAEKANYPNIDWQRIKQLGLTKDLREAGYIRPDGALVDLSGKREGGEPGTRSYDHREAGGVLGMQELVAFGYIRMDINSGILDIGKEPTAQQYSVIEKIAEVKSGEVVIDLADGLGEYDKTNQYYRRPDRIFYEEYPEGTRTQRIINDIKIFYAGGEPVKALFHPEDWQGEFLYGTPIDAEIYSQYVELAKGYESAEAFQADMEGKYGGPGELDLQGEKAARFYKEVWDEAHKPAEEAEVPARVPIQSPVLPSAPTYDYQEKVEAAKDIENPELAAKATTGEITEAEIEKLSTETEGAAVAARELGQTEIAAAEELLASLTAEEQAAVQAGEDLEAAMAERERKAGKPEQLEALERRLKALRTRLRNALAGNAHVAVLMEQQGAWQRILAKEAPLEEAKAYTEGIAFGREIQKLIDEEKAKGKLKETRVRLYAEKRAAVAKVREQARKAAAQKKAAKKLKDARKKLIHDIMRPPGRSIQFRGYAEQIREIQRGLDPVKRQKQTIYSREQWRKFFEEHPESATLMTKEELDRIYSVPLSQMTMAELERIAEILDDLRKMGSLIRHMELVEKNRRRMELKNRLVAAILRGEEYQKPVGGVKATPRLLKGLIATWKPNRVLALLDGVFAGQEKGPFSELGQKRFNEAWGAYKKSVRERMEKVTKKAEELKFSFDQMSVKMLKGYEWIGRDFDIDGFRYTNGKIPSLQDVMYWYIGMQNERTRAALMENPQAPRGGNNIPLAVIMKGISKLTENERKLADAIAEDFEINFVRLRDAFIDTFNMDLPGESHYVPMRRREISYETRMEEVAAELTGRAGVRKQFIARNPTYERIDIADEYQKPIRTDLVNLWIEGVKVQEGFIHQDAIVKEMHAALESDMVREAINQKYGPELNRWLSKYINDLAQAEAYTSMKGLEKLSRMGRAHATVAWLGFNLLSIGKQTVGTLGYLADLGPLGPAYLLSSTAQFAAGQAKGIAGGHFLRNTMVDFVRERSELVRNRQISEELENLKRTNVGLYNNIIGKIGRWGMKGLEAMDITTVCIGWKAVYDKTMHETDRDEVASIAAADEATLRSQPSARVQDMAQIYRMGEVAKWFTMFTSELNAIWNRLTFDVPLALRRKEFFRAIANVTSIAMAGMVIALVSGALQGDDEEKKRKRLLLGLAGEFIESWPIVGNDVFAILSNKQFQSGGVKLIPAISMATQTFKEVTEGDWDAALKNALKTTSLAVGLPYIGPRRAIKAIRTGDVRALLGWPEEKK